MSIGTKAIKQVCIAAWDIDEKQRMWDQVLGMEGKRIRTPLYEKVPSFTDKHPDTFGDTAEILYYELEDEMVLEFMGPGEGDTPWRRYLKEHGEGVMYIGFWVPDRKKCYEQLAEATGVSGPYHVGYYPDTTYSFVDTSRTLGVQLNIKKHEDNTEVIRRVHEDPANFDE